MASAFEPVRRLGSAVAARRPALRLRTKASLLFAFIALVAGVSVAVVAYTFARSSLLDQRTTESRSDALADAASAISRIGEGDPGALNTYLRTVPPEDGFVQVFVAGSLEAFYPTANFSDPGIIPVELRESVAAGGAGTQRFLIGSDPYVAVGIPLPGVDAAFFEAYPLASTEETLRSLLLAFTIGSAVAVVSFGAAGIWIGRRLLRPLGNVAAAAREIAAGDLGTRVGEQRDADLAPLVSAFNGMADAVESRIQRETRFVSDVSHELRSPITALRAAADILERRRDDFDDRPKQAVEVIIDQVRRFDSMVLDLLELSRLDAGAAGLHLESLELAEASRKIATRFGMSTVPIEIAEAAPTAARLDRIRFERVLGNLLENARKHAGGATRIAIDVDDLSTPQAPTVLVAVEDAGPGVDDDERTHIFDRFARGKVGQHQVGTGLGLALVAEHATAMGGSAWVERRTGGGARFVVRLKAVSEDEEPSDEPTPARSTR